MLPKGTSIQGFTVYGTWLLSTVLQYFYWLFSYSALTSQLVERSWTNVPKNPIIWTESNNVNTYSGHHSQEIIITVSVFHQLHAFMQAHDTPFMLMTIQQPPMISLCINKALTNATLMTIAQQISHTVLLNQQS